MLPRGRWGTISLVVKRTDNGPEEERREKEDPRDAERRRAREMARWEWSGSAAPTVGGVASEPPNRDAAPAPRGPVAIATSEHGGERRRLSREERLRERALALEERARAASSGGAPATEPAADTPAPEGPASDGVGGEGDELAGLLRGIGRLEDEPSLRLVARAAKDRIKEIGQNNLVEVRPHGGGHLYLEYRKRGGARRGPYWRYQAVEDGRPVNVYLGKTDEPERVLEEKLRDRPPGR